MYQAIIDGFLSKQAVSNDYILRRLIPVKKQIQALGAVTRRGSRPSVVPAQTGGGEVKRLVTRPGSRRSLKREGGDVPLKGISPETQRFQNLSGLHHEKAEIQARKRFGDAEKYNGHVHPSVIEREARMVKRFGADKLSKNDLDHRREEAFYASQERNFLKKIPDRPLVAGPINEFGQRPVSSPRSRAEGRWYKAYEFYRNI